MSEWVYAIDGDWPDYDHCPQNLETVLFCIEDELREGVEYHVGFCSEEHGQTFAHGIEGCIADRVLAFMRIPEIAFDKIQENMNKGDDDG